MRTLSHTAALFATLIACAICSTSKAQYVLLTHKKIYEPGDSIEFYYMYPEKHTWTSLWLTVEPIDNNGNKLTSAADLGQPGRGWQYYHTSRFGAGKFKMTLTSMTDQKPTVMVEGVFEIRKDRKKYQISKLELDDEQQKEVFLALKKIMKAKMIPYETILKKYNAVAARYAAMEERLDKLELEKINLQIKIGRAAKKVALDEFRQARLKELRAMINGTIPTTLSMRALTSERDSLTKIVNDNATDISATKSNLVGYHKSLDAVELKIKNMWARPVLDIKNEFDQATEQLKKASDELHKAEVAYYEARSQSSVREIKVLAGGNIVYHAKWEWTPDHLLRKLINDLKADSARAANIKREAFEAFHKAKSEEMTAGKKLPGQIWKTAWTTVGIELLFTGIDAAQAFMTGGLSAVVMDLGMKSAMNIYNYATTKDIVFEKGSIESEVFAEYSAMTKNPTRSKYQTAAEAGWTINKDRAYSIGGTAASGAGGTVLEWVKEQISARNTEVVRMSKLSDVKDHFVNFIKGNPVVIGNVVKDVVKQSLLEWAKSDEQKAWIDYLIKGRNAALLYGPYAVAANEFNRVDSLYQLVLSAYGAYAKDEINKLSDNPFKELVNQKFYEDDKLTMIITKEIDAKEFKERIVIGGKEASYSAPHQFIQTVEQKMSEESPGNLKLNLYVFKNPMNGWNPLSYQSNN